MVCHGQRDLVHRLALPIGHSDGQNFGEGQAVLARHNARLHSQAGRDDGCMGNRWADQHSGQAHYACTNDDGKHEHLDV